MVCFVNVTRTFSSKIYLEKDSHVTGNKLIHCKKKQNTNEEYDTSLHFPIVQLHNVLTGIVGVTTIILIK